MNWGLYLLILQIDYWNLQNDTYWRDVFLCYGLKLNVNINVFNQIKYYYKYLIRETETRRVLTYLFKEILHLMFCFNF